MDSNPVSEVTAPEVSPRVSVCLPVLDQSEWLKEAVASVVAQTFKEWELLIFDDGSTHDIKAVVDSFNDKRIKYHRSDQNLGVPHGMNILMKKAVGEFVCMHAADEVIHNEKLAIQVKYLDEHPVVGSVWGLPCRFNGQLILGPMGKREEWEQNILRAHNRSRYAWIKSLVSGSNIPLGGCSMMMRKTVMDELECMDPRLKVFSDHEMYCRFFERYTGAMIPYLLAKDKDPTPECVRAKVSQEDGQKELTYVLGKHPIISPPSDGKISVAIPCYNHAKYLPDLIASIKAQTRPVDEIMILNDCSTDDFKTVVLQFADDPRIRVMAFDENRGMCEAQNQMAFRAEGEFTVVISADDTLETTFVEKCLAKFKENPWLEFVASQNDFVNEDLTPLVPKTPLEKTFASIPKAVNRSREEWLTVLHGGNHYFGAGMYRTYAISEVGGWEKQYKVIADYQMYLKLLQRENIGIVEEPLTHTRIHNIEKVSEKTNDSVLNTERQKELPWLYHAARKPFYRQYMKLIICTPFYELKGFSPYIVSLTNTIRALTMVGIDWRFLELSGDSYVHRARNTICDVFLADPDATDLFFIDSDMSWDAEALVKMCLLPEEVVGGSYPVKNGWDNWTSIPLMKKEDGKDHFQGRQLEDGSALLEAYVLAGGFLRIKRSALEKFREHYPDLWYREPSTLPTEPGRKYTQFFAAESMDHHFIGEDHVFSRRLRDMGMKMWIYPNATLNHFGIKGFEGNLDKHLRENKVKNAETPISLAQQPLPTPTIQ